MRKILFIIFCSICLSFPVPVQAEQNVTNQLDAIAAQLDGLEHIIQFFIDNQENLEWWVGDGFYGEMFTGIFMPLQQIQNVIIAANQQLRDNITPDIASIKADVAALSSNMALYVSQIVASINGLSSDIFAFQTSMEWYLGNLLTGYDLDQSLEMFLNQLTPFLDNLHNIENYSSVLSQILLSIQSLDYSYQVEDALYNIAQALNNLENINVTIDLQEQLDNLDLNLDLDLGTALSGLESDLSSTLSTLEYFSYAFQEFVNLFVYLKNDQEVTNEDLRDFIVWYKEYFFPGLRTVLTAHNEWLDRQEAIEEAEAEHRGAQDVFLTGDADFPTDSDVPYLVELEEALIEDEIEVPDDKIYDASEGVKTDMEDVEHELTGAMDVVDQAFTGFLEDVRFNWGSFNSELSFTYTLPFNDYTMELSYDFATSPLRAPCRAASVGIWGIVLFVQSYLSIVSAIKGVTEN